MRKGGNVRDYMPLARACKANCKLISTKAFRTARRPFGAEFEGAIVSWDCSAEVRRRALCRRVTSWSVLLPVVRFCAAGLC
jgi:hypothetical protein